LKKVIGAIRFGLRAYDAGGGRRRLGTQSASLDQNYLRYAAPRQGTSDRQANYAAADYYNIRGPGKRVSRLHSQCFCFSSVVSKRPKPYPERLIFLGSGRPVSPPGSTDFCL
jgi:hypothetical protein